MHTVLDRMNVKVVEVSRSRERSRCCGGIYYTNGAPMDKVYEKCRERCHDFACEDIVCYCLSCTKFLFAGGKRPRYLVDLLSGEPTTMDVADIVAWKGMVRAFRDAH